jgi:hypothetical protein
LHGAEHHVAGVIWLELVAFDDVGEAELAQVAIEVRPSSQAVELWECPAVRCRGRDAGQHDVAIRSECSDGGRSYRTALRQLLAWHLS